ncbi:MAG TPA: hypothetical protein VF174_15670 [Micromonosporaceae bacterium]
MSDQPKCRSDYYADTGRRQEPGVRIVRCGLSAGHDGDHDEVVDGVPGVVYWPRRAVSDQPAGDLTLRQARAEVERLRAELARWESGQRRKGMPVVESVPDGITYAALLARAQGTEGGEEHDELLREAADRLMRLSVAASNLLAEAQTVRARTEAEQAVIDAARQVVAARREVLTILTADQPPTADVVIQAGGRRDAAEVAEDLAVDALDAVPGEPEVTQ